MCGKPQPIHAHHAQLGVVGVIDGEITHGGAIAVAELRDAGLELLQGVGVAAVEREDDGGIEAAPNT